MCQHWLCNTGTHGWCYFEPGELGVGRAGDGLTDERWDELDRLHEYLRHSRDRRSAASALGKQVTWAVRDALYMRNEAGRQICRELEERYAPAPDPQAPLPLLRIVIRAKQDAVTAAKEIRKLGEELARAIGEELLNEEPRSETRAIR